MPQIPFQLNYSLSRAQRFIPLVRREGVVGSAFVVMMFLLFVVECVLSLILGVFEGVALLGALALGTYWLHRQIFVPLADVVFVPLRKMDVTVEENAAGVLIGKERWYLFLDGIKAIRKYRNDIWTVEHFGTVLQIAASAITEEQLEYLRAAMERGRTPEGIQAVIERGKRIRRISEIGSGSHS